MLFVLVMAAIIAVMLYKEMPIAAFEAQRQKEEMLVERGGEYKHGIKLFVRKFGRYPGTIAELESTNRIRFLRRKYDDPLTGKDDWRVLHAGAGGVIIDSQIKDKSKTPGSGLGQGATFAGFNNSIVQADPNAEVAAPVSAGMRQRPSATTNAGASTAANGGLDFPLVPNTGQNPVPGSDLANGAPMPGQNASQNGSQMPPASNSSTGAGLTTLANDPGVANAPAGASGNAAVMQQLNQQNPLTPQTAATPPTTGLQNTGAFPQNVQPQNGQQQLAAGGIAGVASKAPGKSIKEVNDQTKYSLWEFVYDLRKEQSANMPGVTPQNSLNGQQQNGANNNSAFGSGGGSGGFNSNGAAPAMSGMGQQQPGAPAQGAPPTPPE